jgi:hypothetical protein
MAKSKKRHDDISAPASDGASDASRNGDFSERVATRAYELYLERGGGDGQDFDDWLAAERELTGPPGQSRK